MVKEPTGKTIRFIAKEIDTRPHTHQLGYTAVRSTEKVSRTAYRENRHGGLEAGGDEVDIVLHGIGTRV